MPRVRGVQCLSLSGAHLKATVLRVAEGPHPPLCVLHPVSVRPLMGISAVSMSWLLSIGSADVLLKSCFHFLWPYTQEWVAESQGKSIFLFFEEPPYCFP